MPKLSKKKYINLILYLAKELGGEIRGKKKLAKLLYYVDFDNFELSEKSVTSDVYKAYPMGPFPTSMEAILKEMESKGLIETKSINEIKGYNATEVYKLKKNPDEDVFSIKEKRIIKRVIKNYGHLTGKQLEDLSHAEAPYIGTDANEEIHYELAFYRDTDFSR